METWQTGEDRLCCHCYEEQQDLFILFVIDFRATVDGNEHLNAEYFM